MASEQLTAVENPQIFKAMTSVLKDFGAVEKGRKNDHFGYNFRGIDDALAALHPLLAKHGVFLLITDMQSRYESAPKDNTRCVVSAHVRYVASDGSYVEASMNGEGMDKGDKALMKAQANALKYCIYYTFCVPTEEPKDSEAFPEPTEEEKPKFKVEKPANDNRKTRKEAPTTPVVQRNVKPKSVDASGPIDITPYMDGISAATSPEELDGVVSLIKERSATLDPGLRKQLVDKIKEKRVQLA